MDTGHMEFAVVEQQLLVGNQAEQDWLRWYRQAEQLLGANLDGDGGYASKLHELGLGDAARGVSAAARGLINAAEKAEKLAAT
ncbi:hypothetical protein [Delftia sp. JD2]|uniref:hypothetical protein n=1 Tax=Delftia sp. JD2 TaxID=469553 RepID=UPI0008069F3A|nr:hypothetical protein [Delftia sp. JD2]OBY86977.1 hypothetical protein ACM14_02250 [Delftia sp. JD2]